MVLPLNLAMNASELRFFPNPPPCAWMACQFSPYGEGISNIPASLPPDSMLILNDRMPCQGHSADLVAAQMKDAAIRFRCESVLLDFQRPENEEAALVAAAIVHQLSIPVAVSEYYAASLPCAVFLGPNPLHVPLEEHIAPWKERDIWLEAALCQEIATVTKDGSSFSPCFPPEHLDGGFFDETLCCCYHTRILHEAIEFVLFDTPESLQKKMGQAQSLGVSRAVGLYQELGERMNQK